MKADWIASPGGVERIADEVKRAGRCALDTEADSLHSYFHKVCLIQVSVGGRHALVDPLAVPSGALAPLWAATADPGVRVVMHGADYDLRVLDRDYGARVRGLEDTQVMALLLGEPKTGLAALLDKELGVGLDKSHQRADWGRRPLPAAMLAYAAADTAHLEELAVRLRARLEEVGRWRWAEEEFRKLESVRHTPPPEDELAFERIKGARSLRGAARDRLHALYLWREDVARQRDVPPFKVLGNREMVAAAEVGPTDLEALGRVPGFGPRLVRAVGRPVVQTIGNAGAAPARRRSLRPAPPAAAEKRRREAVTAVRDAAAAELGIEPGVVCPRWVLDAVAAGSPAPTTLAGLGAAGLEGWRLEVLGGRLLEALARTTG